MMDKLTTAELDHALQAAPFVLLDFSSPGCAPCKKIAQTLPAFLESLPIKPAAYEVDIVSDPELAARYFVLGVPALILFKAGKEIGRFNSLPKADAFLRLLS
jgi:thiol-disulfide isomerase/thioredoxin